MRERLLNLGALELLAQAPIEMSNEQSMRLRLMIMLVEGKPMAAQKLHLFWSRGLIKLHAYLHSGPDELSELAANALRSIVLHRQCKPAYRDCLRHQIPERLNMMLKSHVPSLSTAAARLIDQLAISWPEIRQRLFAGFGPELQALVRNKSLNRTSHQAASKAFVAVTSGTSFKLPSPSTPFHEGSEDSPGESRLPRDQRPAESCITASAKSLLLSE